MDSHLYHHQAIEQLQQQGFRMLAPDYFNRGLTEDTNKIDRLIIKKYILMQKLLVQNFIMKLLLLVHLLFQVKLLNLIDN